MRLTLSIAVLLVLAAVWLFDVVALFNGRSSETVSATLREWSLNHPVVPFLGGVLTGHILWP